MKGTVLSYNALAQEAGKSAFEAGGNAFDAFVAATMMEYVVAEGGTSMAGPLGALTYNAQDGAIRYLDGGWNALRDPRSKWSPEAEDRPGLAVLVGGAVAALEQLSKRYGNLAFADVLEPAIYAASEGFQISEKYEWCVRWRKDILERTDYGKKTFFPDDQGLREGDLFKQPAVADLLRGLAKRGAAYMYKGPWAREWVETVNRAGGHASLQDLGEYRARWLKPYKARYRGYDLFSSSGCTYGGTWAILALNVLQQLELDRKIHYSASADCSELLIRLTRLLWSRETWLNDPVAIDDRTFMNHVLSKGYAAEVARAFLAQEAAEARATKPMAHSYHVIAIDDEGNAITGTNTINSNPWGEGLFVQGLPLCESAKFLYLDGTRIVPGARAPLPFSMHMGFAQNRLQFVSGAFSDSVLEASLQFLINVMDYELGAEEAVKKPRFGTFVTDLDTLAVDTSRNWIDERTDRDILRALKDRGLRTHADPTADTGLGGVALLRDDGSIDGALTPAPPLRLSLRQTVMGVFATIERYWDAFVDAFKEPPEDAEKRKDAS